MHWQCWNQQNNIGVLSTTFYFYNLCCTLKMIDASHEIVVINKTIGWEGPMLRSLTVSSLYGSERTRTSWEIILFCMKKHCSYFLIKYFITLDRTVTLFLYIFLHSNKINATQLAGLYQGTQTVLLTLFFKKIKKWYCETEQI